MIRSQLDYPGEKEIRYRDEHGRRGREAVATGQETSQTNSEILRTTL